jgi:hypothetical protein
MWSRHISYYIWFACDIWNIKCDLNMRYETWDITHIWDMTHIWYIFYTWNMRYNSYMRYDSHMIYFLHMKHKT